jgi:hypothetical protein
MGLTARIQLENSKGGEKSITGGKGYQGSYKVLPFEKGRQRGFEDYRSNIGFLTCKMLLQAFEQDWFSQ